MDRRKFIRNSGLFGFGAYVIPNSLYGGVLTHKVLDLPKLKEGYKVRPIEIRKIKLTDSFWLPIVKKVQDVTIEYGINKIKEEGRLDNFLIAGGKMKGDVKGKMVFDDSDVYKIIEGASSSLINSPNAKLSSSIDEMISIIAMGQEEDGYLTTWRTINPKKPPSPWVKVKEGKRWESLDMSHELYNVGHLYHAAASHFRATGKRSLLEIAQKNADLIVRTFGQKPNQIGGVPGHQVIETGLIKLYEVTGDKKYLEQARYFLDKRGDPNNHKLYGEYSQDHLPVTQQKEVVGHAVRAVYMYAGMTDIAALQHDPSYRKAVVALWENMVNKKMYITGGIGSRHENEGFGENYELPNLTAYNETCAAIGNIYWNHDMFKLTGESKYFDIIERVLYNGLLSGLSLSGTQFFYPNPLESDGEYKFNQGALTRKDWFDVSCCPTNLMRMLPSVSELIYAKNEDTVFINLYVGSEVDVDLSDKSVRINQITNYPWDNKIKIEVLPEQPSTFVLKLRVPGWAEGRPTPGNLYKYSEWPEKEVKVHINGKILFKESENGYIVLDRKWKKGDHLQIEFPMGVREVIADEKAEADNEKVSLEIGPLVYVVEEADNNNIENVRIKSETEFDVVFEDNLLGGVNTVNFDGIKAIPYYSWSNRGVGKMKTWLKRA